MKDKTEATKILLEKGWTLDEVLKVLGESEKIIINPAPMPYLAPYWIPIQPTQPYRWVDWHPIITTSGTSASVTSVTYKTDNPPICIYDSIATSIDNYAQISETTQ